MTFARLMRALAVVGATIAFTMTAGSGTPATAATFTPIDAQTNKSCGLSSVISVGGTAENPIVQIVATSKKRTALTLLVEGAATRVPVSSGQTYVIPSQFLWGGTGVEVRSGAGTSCIVNAYFYGSFFTGYYVSFFGNLPGIVTIYRLDAPSTNPVCCNGDVGAAA